MSKFNTCPSCGSNLDHGERCDCEKNRPELLAPENEPAQSAGQLATANPLPPVLAPGA